MSQKSTYTYKSSGYWFSCCGSHFQILVGGPCWLVRLDVFWVGKSWGLLFCWLWSWRLGFLGCWCWWRRRLGFYRLRNWCDSGVVDFWFPARNSKPCLMCRPQQSLSLFHKYTCNSVLYPPLLFQSLPYSLSTTNSPSTASSPSLYPLKSYYTQRIPQTQRSPFPSPRLFH